MKQSEIQENLMIYIIIAFAIVFVSAFTYFMGSEIKNNEKRPFGYENSMKGYLGDVFYISISGMSLDAKRPIKKVTSVKRGKESDYLSSEYAYMSTFVDGDGRYYTCYGKEAYQLPKDFILE